MSRGALSSGSLTLGLHRSRCTVLLAPTINGRLHGRSLMRVITKISEVSLNLGP